MPGGFQVKHSKGAEVAAILVLQVQVRNQYPRPPTHFRGAKLRYGPGQVALAGSNRRLQKNVRHPIFDPIQNEVDRPLLSRADSFAGGRKKVEPVVYSRAQIARLIPQIYRCGAGFSE
jgi:hypothetical protein